MAGYSSFVVRIWTDAQKGVPRGHIQHVGTEESMRFTNMDKMVEFILRHLKDSQSPAQDQAKEPESAQK